MIFLNAIFVPLLDIFSFLVPIPQVVYELTLFLEIVYNISAQKLLLGKFVFTELTLEKCFRWNELKRSLHHRDEIVKMNSMPSWRTETDYWKKHLNTWVLLYFKIEVGSCIPRYAHCGLEMSIQEVYWEDALQEKGREGSEGRSCAVMQCQQDCRQSYPLWWLECFTRSNQMAQTVKLCLLWENR